MYFIRRLLLMIPTFLGITLITFVVLNATPGGPVEQKLQELRFGSQTGAGGSEAVMVSSKLMDEIKKHYGFDKPVLERYWIWLKNLACLDFGESFVYEEPALNVILSKFPVSIQFGLISLLLTYLVCIPLGVFKALKPGSWFDQITGYFLYVSYSIPPLVFGIFLIVFFAGSSYLNWFPIGGLQSERFAELTVAGKFFDRIHHFILPLLCYVLGSFTEITILMRNSMLDVINSDYVRTARAKGLSENRVIFVHALRNALIPIVTGLSGFLGFFLAGSLIIETLFSLDGVGLLSYKSLQSRDYNVIMGLVFLSSLVLLLGRFLSDLVYTWVNPRIDFK